MKHAHLVDFVGKKITQQKDVGQALELIYVLHGIDQMTKPMMPQVMEEHPISSITQKRQLQANQLRRRLNQRTNFATTPYT